MHRLSWGVKISIVAFVVVLLSGTIFVEAQRNNQAQSKLPIIPTVFMAPTSTRPPNCAPFPQEPTNDLPPTTTPDRFTTPVVDLRPTVTPLTYEHTIDLNPEVPLDDKFQVIVFRCAGYFDLYLAGPDINIDQNIPLATGDVIFQTVPPLSLMMTHPPTPTGRPTFIPSTPSTPLPYPPPVTIVPPTDTPFPYPPPITSTPINVEP